jgi:cytoskeleton protein RodZ
MSVGSELRKAREGRKISLQTICDKTRIPVKYLEALEEDHFDLFPSQAHAKGFIRAYAKVVGLETADLMARFKSQVEPVSAKITPPNPENEIPSGFSWPFFKKKPRLIRRERISDAAFDPDLETQEPEPSSRRAPASGSSAPSVARRRLGRGARTVLLRLVFLLALVGALIWTGPSVKRLAGSAWHWSIPTFTSSNPASAAVLPGLPVKDKFQHLILKGLDQSWILVTMDGGQFSSEFDLAPGEVKSFRALQSFKVKIGNAGGVDARFNGRPLGVLGATGQVVEMSLPDSGS